ncbi:MAG: helix-turn-helix domain-containing protein, partial [Trebonia sp.]
MSSDADWLRREMGRELATRRRAAGLSQAELAAHTRRYSRATVSHAELGKDDVGRGFWEAADRLLATGSFFADACELVTDSSPRSRTLVTSSGPDLRGDPAMRSAVPGQALRAYRQRGWPVAGHA